MGLKILLLLLSGFGTSFSSPGVSYHFVNQTMDWTSAQTFCRTNYTDLLSIENAEENSLFTSSYPEMSYWIGLHDNNVSWVWFENSTPLSSASTNLLTWSTAPPDWSDPREYCVALLAGKAELQDCSLSALALCSTQALSGRVFLLVPTSSNWAAAQVNCALVNNDLASVLTQQDKTTIKTFFMGTLILSSSTAWIGLYRKPWMWSDQSSSLFRNWGLEKNYDLRASQHCVSVTGTGVWTVTDCALELPFVCYEGSLTSSESVGVRKEQVLRMTITSTEDMNDPDVQTQLLKQLEEEMTKHGVSDFNLRWIPSDGGNFTTKEEEDTLGGILKV